MEPFLTVAAQPAYEMGQRATQILLERLGHTAPEECREVVLPFEIIVRRSSGPPHTDPATNESSAERGPVMADAGHVCTGRDRE